MPSMTPLASICIPTHAARRLPYLREALASALGQTCPDIEIIISNDGQDPTLREFAEGQVRADARIRYRGNPQRLGLGGNWNAVANDARGEYLVIIGDDDRLLPRFVETLLSARMAETAVLFSNHHIIDPSGARVDALTHQFLVGYGRDALPPGELVDPVADVWRNSVPMSSALIRTADVKRLGIKPDLNTPEIELFARLASEGKSFVFVPEYLVEYRVHPHQETTGGLAGDRLIKYLDPISVPPAVEPLKRRFIGDLASSAVNMALNAGEVERARAMMRHRYYPSLRARPGHVLAHRLLSSLPAPLAKQAFGAVARARRRLRRALSDW
jgi:glycosyltransferase involved in cell wall biosynthesis